MGSFSLFSGLIILIILMVAFVHFVQGFFSAAISMILVVVAAALALGYHETVVEKFLGAQWPDTSHGLALLGLFAVCYIVPRILFDKFIPGNVILPSGIDKGGAAVMGLIAGVFAGGVVAFAGQEFPFAPGMWGYARYKVEDAREVTLPVDRGQMTRRFVYDILESDKPLHEIEKDQVQRLLLPADDVMLSTVTRLSSGGLAGSGELSHLHPDWLKELFGQRLGIQTAARRVNINLPGKDIQEVVMQSDNDHPEAGLYYLQGPIPQKEGELPVIRKRRGELKPLFPPTPDKNKIIVAARIYFTAKASDKNRLIRLSTGAVRLVTQHPGDDGQTLEYTDYFPIGTLEDARTMYVQKPDDFLFVSEDVPSLAPTQADEPVVKDKGDKGADLTAKDKGIDLVFYIDKRGFLENPNENDPSKWKISPGTFLEVKRMAREDFSETALKGTTAKLKMKPDPTIIVVRKPLVVNPPKLGERPKSDDDESDAPKPKKPAAPVPKKS